MDKLLTRPLTLHETLSISRLLLTCSSLHCHLSQTSIQLPAPSGQGTAPCPLVTAPKEPFHASLQSVPQAREGLTVNKTNPFHYQVSNPSLQAPFCSSNYGTLDVVNVHGPKL